MSETDKIDMQFILLCDRNCKEYYLSYNKLLRASISCHREIAYLSLKVQ